MVRIQIYDLHPSPDKELINEVNAGEMKTVQGGVLSNATGRQFSNSLDANNSPTTTEPETSRVNSLQEVNSLLDNFRLELDKIFRKLV
ncbi:MULTISPECIES: hypothetical protein [Nostoc]|uniref:Uncharacterized protein n=1 Tax=Nostoc paludosum FACHB-159 TaxID=2692908 RepID=A0ABR8K6W1_9NOSO|nr:MULTISPECIES: hypothetical protein [Nostoc]MBD2678851.1 hypothetical protein [Nostoc sp. FACHB-857]MBD2735229.1 hypothetical protein [Nostoc paludosum FACHB-159]